MKKNDIIENEILCCFYTEFNTETGAEIICQFPEEY